MAGTPRVPDGLLARALAGDAAALRELLLSHRAMLERELRQHQGGRVRRRESIDDLTQSLVGDLLPAVERVRFDDLAGFRGWLRRAARNKLIDKERYHASARRDPVRERDTGGTVGQAPGRDSVASPSRAAMRAEDHAALHSALAQLTDERRRVVVMARLEGRPHREIAASLGKTEEACRMLLRRALIQLSELLDRSDCRDGG